MADIDFNVAEVSLLSRNGGDSLTSSDATYVYQVAHTSQISEYQARNAIGANGDSIPALNSTHPQLQSMLCVDRRAVPISEDDNESKWQVTAKFAGPTPLDPSTAFPEITIDSVQYTEVAENAWGVNLQVGPSPELAIVNAAQDKFDPPVQKQVSRAVITIVKNMTNFNPDWIAQFENSINLDKTRIAGFDVDVLEAKITKMSAIPAGYIDGYGDIKSYYVVTFNIEINKRKHTKEILNAGLNYLDYSLDPENPKKRQITIPNDDNELVPAQEPQLLKADGDILESGGTPIYFAYIVDEPKSWTTLDLPLESTAIAEQVALQE